jgi:hypothetical protein
MAKKRAHLVGFIQHGVNSHATGMWRYPKDKINWEWSRPAYWQHIARTMERGLSGLEIVRRSTFDVRRLAGGNSYRGSSPN